MGRTDVRGWALPLALLLLAGCDNSPAGPIATDEVVDLSGAWREASPEAVGFGEGVLQRALDDAASLTNLRALTVVRNGRLVGERHYRGATADTVFDVRSVTKTVTALLVGIAREKGLLEVTDSLPRWFSDHPLRPEHLGIRIDHLLTMTSGIQWSDEENFGPWVQSGRPVEYVLELDVVAAPGQRFIYNSGGSHLLAVAVGRAAGMNTLDFATAYLFDPLGIVRGYWASFENGDPAGAAGLALTARDLAKLGQLVLQEGASGGTQVVAGDWVREQTRTRVPLGKVGGVLGQGGYGFQTWTDETPPEAVVMWGFGGQFVWVVPDRRLVVVAASAWRGIGYPQARQQADALAAFIRERIVGAAR